jgi:hypothetical protein
MSTRSSLLVCGVLGAAVLLPSLSFGQCQGSRGGGSTSSTMSPQASISQLALARQGSTGSQYQRLLQQQMLQQYSQQSALLQQQMQQAQLQQYLQAVQTQITQLTTAQVQQLTYSSNTYVRALATQELARRQSTGG